MGDIADMMLNGTLCSQCGSFLGKTDIGVPMQCEFCCDSLSQRKTKFERPHKRKKRQKKVTSND